MLSKLKKLIIIFLCIAIAFTNFSSAEEIKIENINFSYDDYSLSWEIKNYGNEKSFTIDVFFDGEKIHSNEYTLKRDEILNDVVYLGGNEKVKNTISDCKEHIINIKISYGGKTTGIKKIIKDPKYIDYKIEISPDPINGNYNYLVNFANETPKFGYGDRIKFLCYDNNGNLIRDLEGDVYLKKYGQEKYEKVGSGLTITDEGAIEVQPWKYGIGNYKVIIKQKALHGEKLYCTKELNFDVKGKIVIRNLPSSARIGEDVMLTILTEGTITYEGRKGGRFYVRIKNLENNKEDILTIGSGLSTIILNSTYFPIPGRYKITAYKDENYWEDTREILITDKPKLEISVPEEVEIGKSIDIMINADNEPIENLEVEIVNPDGSITIYKKEKFSFTPTIYGDYEIIAKSENYASSSKKFKVLDDMFLEIKTENDNIKVGDVVEFRVYDKHNKTLYPKIYVNGNEIKTYTYMIKDIKTNITAELDGYLPVKKEIFAYGIIKINVSNQSIEYGEKIKISVNSNPYVNDCDIKILNKDTNESINYKGNFYEFFPKAGSYKVIVSKENYIPAEANFYVKKANVKFNISYEIDWIIIKITHNEIPVENAKIYIQTPQGKNLTFITNNNGIAKFKADEGGIYKIYKIEKENFENIEKEIIIDVPGSNIVAIIALIGIIILIIFLIYVVYRILTPKKEKVEEKYELEYEEGGLIGI